MNEDAYELRFLHTELLCQALKIDVRAPPEMELRCVQIIANFARTGDENLHLEAGRLLLLNTFTPVVKYVLEGIVHRCPYTDELTNKLYSPYDTESAKVMMRARARKFIMQEKDVPLQDACEALGVTDKRVAQLVSERKLSRSHYGHINRHSLKAELMERGCQIYP